MEGNMKLSSDDFFINNAKKIVEEGNKRGIILRIIGSIAARIHCQEFSGLHRKLGRLGEGKQSFSDIDFVAYGKQRKKVRELLEKEFGLKIDEAILFYYGENRHIYYSLTPKYHVDVFFDKLSFSHDIYFGSEPGKGRLEFDYPTIPLSDLMLEKTQIHDINEKDLKDLIVILRAHELGEKDEKEILNLRRLSQVLADDWEFYYDAKTSLEKLNVSNGIYYEKRLMTQEDFNDARNKINAILEYLNKMPKTKKWQKRAKKGIRKKWWRSVEEVRR
jgi:hypothetical protein